MKKILLIATATMMTVSLLAGCAKDKNNTPTETTQVETTASEENVTLPPELWTNENALPEDVFDESIMVESSSHADTSENSEKRAEASSGETDLPNETETNTVSVENIPEEEQDQEMTEPALEEEEESAKDSQTTDEFIDLKENQLPPDEF